MIRMKGSPGEEGYSFGDIGREGKAYMSSNVSAFGALPYKSEYGICGPPDVVAYSDGLIQTVQNGQVLSGQYQNLP